MARIPASFTSTVQWVNPAHPTIQGHQSGHRRARRRDLPWKMRQMWTGAVGHARRAFEHLLTDHSRGAAALLPDHPRRFTRNVTPIGERHPGTKWAHLPNSQTVPGRHCVGHISAMLDVLETFEFESAADQPGSVGAGWVSAR